MTDKIEITIDVIIHATEDLTKFFERFEEVFGIKEENFTLQNLVGHFDNPIILMNTKITKKIAEGFIENFAKNLSDSQKNEIFEDILDRVSNSTLHLRLDKQEFIKGNIEFKEKDPIKLRIHTPIYSKKDTEKKFREIFNFSN